MDTMQSVRNAVRIERKRLEREMEALERKAKRLQAVDRVLNGAVMPRRHRKRKPQVVVSPRRRTMSVTARKAIGEGVRRAAALKRKRNGEKVAVAS